MVVYCSQALNTNIKVNNTEENFTDSSTSNSIPASSAAPSDKKLLCTVVSILHTNKGDCYVENINAHIVKILFKKLCGMITCVMGVCPILLEIGKLQKVSFLDS